MNRILKATGVIALLALPGRALPGTTPLGGPCDVNGDCSSTSCNAHMCVNGNCIQDSYTDMVCHGASQCCSGYCGSPSTTTCCSAKGQTCGTSYKQNNKTEWTYCCGSGLGPYNQIQTQVCNTASDLCVSWVGGTCTTDSDCIGGLKCDGSGHCACAALGAACSPGQLCCSQEPCPSGGVCPSTCYDDPHACTQNSDCCGGICMNGACRCSVTFDADPFDCCSGTATNNECQCAATGSSCSLDSQCCSGYCPHVVPPAHQLCVACLQVQYICTSYDQCCGSAQHMATCAHPYCDSATPCAIGSCVSNSCSGYTSCCFPDGVDTAHATNCCTGYVSGGKCSERPK